MVRKNKLADDLLWERAQNCIAQGALTNSKRPASFIEGVYPRYAEYGKGCFLYAHDGKGYMDFICGLGANWLGYGHEAVSQAVEKEIRRGTSHSLPTHIEIEAAEALKQMYTFVDKVKFLKTGTDACNGAIKIARAATGRKKILSDGYHGHGDAFVQLMPPAYGVCGDGEVKKFLGPETIDKETAAVIIEPVQTDASTFRQKEVRAIYDQCKKVGSLLIFDEVITALRFEKFGVCNAWAIEPDLLVGAKALGNGFPISFIAGKTPVMECAEYFISGTFYGETASLAAAKAVIEYSLKNAADIGRLILMGQDFQRKSNVAGMGFVGFDGYGTRAALGGRDPTAQALFMQETCKAGLLFGKSWFINLAMLEYLDMALRTTIEIIGRVVRGGCTLEGNPPVSPFAEKARKNEK